MNGKLAGIEKSLAHQVLLGEGDKETWKEKLRKIVHGQTARSLARGYPGAAPRARTQPNGPPTKARCAATLPALRQGAPRPGEGGQPDLRSGRQWRVKLEGPR